MRRGRQTYSRATLAAFVLPIEPVPDDETVDDHGRQAREREALVASLRQRIGEMEAGHRLPIDGDDQK